MSAPMKTLPDLLRPGLRAVCVGVNPSPPSVAAGYYFASRTNRFWRALNAAQFTRSPLDPGPQAIETLFNEYGVGFTDIVKRPTPMAKDLRAADYREGAQILLDKLAQAAPGMVWFHGKLVVSNFRRYALHSNPDTDWGLQDWHIGQARVFVTPNPSAANAAFSLADLTTWYRRAATLLYK